MATRYIIGRGELLTFDIPPPPIMPTKAHPYSLAEAKAFVIPQISEAVAYVSELPDLACPSEMAVIQVDLHPAYIAKSFFPKALLRQAGLTSLGSKTVRVRPRKDVRKNAPDECETTRMFIAGTRDNLARLPKFAARLKEDTPEGLQFAEIERVFPMTVADRVRPVESITGNGVFEVGLHQMPEKPIDELRRNFIAYAVSCGFTVNRKFEFPVGRMLFLAVEGPTAQLEELAKFTMVRVVRAMPTIRSARPLSRSNPIAIPFSLPRAQPLSNEPSVAILDGGLPSVHVLQSYVGRYEKADTEAGDVLEYVDHGLGVTSAFLFGPIEPGSEAQRPFSFVDHYRVLDAKTNTEDPYELYRTLAHVEEVLLARQYQFINLSLGPDLPFDDADVHAWTAVMDSLLSDGETLVSVAVGNNGERDEIEKLDRIQVPSDSVNAISVGAADRTGSDWKRASYSAKGPGRSPGRRKPDVVAFGGSPKEYFHVPLPGPRPQLGATMGTSFAAPLALRTAVGIRAILGDQVHPLTIKALLVHAATLSSHASVIEAGWGKVSEDINEIITCEDGVARIIYQGSLSPGKYLRAPIPLPPEELKGKVKLSATFCYASPVDVEDAAAYTKAGLTITFRPHSEKKTKGGGTATRSFFSTSEFRTESDQRNDLGKWETVLHASDNFYGSSLNNPIFDIHYNARDGGANAGARSQIIRFALVITVEAPKHLDVHEKILAAHQKLRALEPRISIPIRT